MISFIMMVIMIASFVIVIFCLC